MPFPARDEKGASLACPECSSDVVVHVGTTVHLVTCGCETGCHTEMLKLTPDAREKVVSLWREWASKRITDIHSSTMLLSARFDSVIQRVRSA